MLLRVINRDAQLLIIIKSSEFEKFIVYRCKYAERVASGNISYSWELTHGNPVGLQVIIKAPARDRCGVVIGTSEGSSSSKIAHPCDGGYNSHIEK